MSKSPQITDHTMSTIQNMASTHDQADAVVEHAADYLWAEKRKQQRRDIEAVASGEVRAADLGWLGSELASRATILSDIF